MIRTPRYQQWPSMAARLHVWLNELVLEYGDEPLVGPVLWWAFGEIQRWL